MHLLDDVARYVFGELDQNDLSKKRAAAAARGDPMTSNKTFKNNKPKKTSVANSSRNKKVKYNVRK
jgi:hypothetical protein